MMQHKNILKKGSVNEFLETLSYVYFFFYIRVKLIEHWKCCGAHISQTLFQENCECVYSHNKFIVLVNAPETLDRKSFEKKFTIQTIHI